MAEKSFDLWLDDFEELLDSGSKKTGQSKNEDLKIKLDGQSEGQRKDRESKCVKNRLGLKSEDFVVEPDNEPVQERKYVKDRLGQKEDQESKSVKDRLGQREEQRDGKRDVQREGQEIKSVKDRLGHNSGSNWRDHQDRKSAKDRLGWHERVSAKARLGLKTGSSQSEYQERTRVIDRLGHQSSSSKCERKSAKCRLGRKSILHRLG